MNNFILTYSPFSVAPTPGQLLNHVQINRYITSYYQPYPGTYVIKSDQTAGFLTTSLKGLFEEVPFMLAQVFPYAMGGTLPQDIWHWINHGYVPTAPPATNALGRYLSQGGIGSEKAP